MPLYIKTYKGVRIKPQFRKFCKTYLTSLTKKINFEDKKTIRILKNELIALGAKRVLLYCPMKSEVNIYPLIIWLKKRGTKVFIPYIDGVSFKMIPFRLPLHKNEYNIFEAKKSLFYLTKIDTAIVPILGIDKRFKRIGFGKGMYDRFFQTLSYRPNVIFISRRAIISKSVLTDSYDIFGDKFISSFCIVKRGIDDRILGDRVYNICFHSGK
ncbi:5-formyltetrahydrofolate cyclo-ligase [Helicobacter sp. 12S02232-10]|uniref:5-formyltetrahydrofolate cyclo-ligase n=1 Tax=Helicobacter sp. 12S02232-10 TaxID=1476197 RepID=UPI000BA699DE|nr:5-formyltetrahydrofolate cyclo-ligase [Helicobacter sp. 12S02232-10]PAF48322.1 5-formyltetrahydrofolate cyclo-ligase [Helicobacter sp. 12S02232-10]